MGGTLSNHNAIVEAIQDRRRVEFEYCSNGEDTATVRIVDPWVYGSRNGKESLVGYQVEGGSGSEPRRFNLSKVKKIRVLDDKIENSPNAGPGVTKWEKIYAELK